MLSARFQAMRDAQIKSSQPESDEDSASSKTDDRSEDDEDEEEEDSSSDDETAKQKEKDIEELEEVEDTRKEDSSAAVSSMTFVCKALGDFVAEDESDLSFSKGDLLTVISMRDDGWWQVENQEGEKGTVPSTFLKVPEKIRKYFDGVDSSHHTEEKSHLWGKLRSTVKQAHTFEGALTAMGALPIGFCSSSLLDLLNKDSRFSTEAFLAPKLSESGLSFKDIKWSNETSTLKVTTTRLQRAIRLVAFRQVHPPGLGYEVTSRHVRVCLHDGSKVLSNIHTIRAKWDSKVPKIWTFLPKISADGCCLEEGQFFIRSNSSAATIGVLFQLCVSYKKVDSDVAGEMSCGWVFMRLLDDSGLPVPNRTKVLNIHSGTPFVSEQGSPSAADSKENALKLFMNKSKQPRLVVTITTLKRKTDQLLTYLPTTLIGPVSSLPLVVLYRKILADKLLKDRASFDSAELIQSPFLSNFPKLFNQPDILDAFRTLWTDKSKKFKQAFLKNEDKRKSAFQQVFSETAFLILQCASLPCFTIGEQQNEQLRKSEIAQIMKLLKDKGPQCFAMSPDHSFYPLSIESMSLNIIGPYHQQIKGID